MGGLKTFSQPLWIIVLGTAPVYYGRRIFYYGRPLKIFRIFLPGNSTSLLWEEDFLLWEASKNYSQPLYIFVLETAPVYYGRRIVYYGRPQKLFTITLNYWLWNSTSLLWEEDFFFGRAQKLFTITLDYWPGNSTSLLWEKDFLL